MKPWRKCYDLNLKYPPWAYVSWSSFGNGVDSSKGRLIWKKEVTGDMNLRVILVPNHFIFTAMNAHYLIVLPKYMGQTNNGLKCLKL